MHYSERLPRLEDSPGKGAGLGPSVPSWVQPACCPSILGSYFQLLLKKFKNKGAKKSRSLWLLKNFSG